VNKEDRLIALYLYVCGCYDTELSVHCQRFSNHHQVIFTDQEVITIFLFAMLEDEKFTIKQIHSHIEKYWLSWFPNLPGYQQFNKRLNRLAPVFPVLSSRVLSEAALEGVDWGTSLGDSMPIVLAQKSRSYQAKVAPELCNQGYCASKKLTYYGVKLHTLGFRRAGALPLPEYLQLTPASQHDLNAMRHIFPQLSNRQLFLDKAYCDKELAEELIEQAQVALHTPRKKKKGEQDIGADGRLISTAVSRVRQPIESLFNWVDQKTAIQYGSKIRSTKGLLVHVFGRLSAAMILLCLPVFN
jgi:hypothetical protein